MLGSRIPHLAGSGKFAMEIVGESHYQGAIERVAGPHTRAGVRKGCLAELYLEPNNPHDPNAVRIEIDGQTVGYLSRNMALAMRRGITKAGVTDKRFGVDAVIVGGHIGQSFGVWLDLDVLWEDDEDDEDEPSQAIKPTKYGAGVATGWASPDEPK